MAHVSMLGFSFLSLIGDLISGLFAIIPQVMYLLYASIASLLDVLQLMVRKFAGLDVYYVNGAETSGDVLRDFFEGIVGINTRYSVLNTVFWALIVFGAMVLVLTTILAIIRAHYNYDEKKSNPITIITQSFKSLCLMAIVPVLSIFGIRLLELTLQTLDQLTTYSGESTISAIYESDAVNNLKSVNVGGTVYYSSFDFLNEQEWTNTSSFSGMLFEIAAFDANRVRMGKYEPTSNSNTKDFDNCGIFYSTKEGDLKENVATQIDYAFKNCLTLNSKHTVRLKGESIAVIGSSLNFGPSAIFAMGLIGVEHFSKFNVGLVWYYYDLWAFNFFLGFAGVATIFGLLVNIVFGLMKRIILCVALFLLGSPIIGISPLDSGNGFKSWKKTYISYLIACVSTIVGMNLFFLISTVLYEISFFNVVFLDKLFNIIVILAGLTMVKKFIALLSSFIGAADLNSEGEKTKKAVAENAMKGASGALAMSRVGMGLAKFNFGTALGKGSVGNLITGGKLNQGLGFVGGKIKGAVGAVKGAVTNTLMGNNALGKKLAKVMDNGIVKNALGYLGIGGLSKGEASQNVTTSKKDDKNLKGLHYTETETVDAEGNLMKDEKGNQIYNIEFANKEDAQVYALRKNMKGIGKNVLNTAGQVFKCAGSLLGFDKALEAAVKAGLTDELKGTFQFGAHVAGRDDVVEQMKSGEFAKDFMDGEFKGIFQTAKDKKKTGKKKEEKKKQQIDDAASDSILAANAIFKLTEKLKGR